jgi:adenosylcobinamide-GDP ribazoletransferase
MNLRYELRLVLVALQFLTRVPVRLQVFDPAWLHASARHFPLIGIAVGAFGAAVWWGAALVWPPAVAVLLAMAATIAVTGAFHEDGLADTCDGLGGAVTRERALVIMKDSRLGSYGAVGLGLTLALKAAALIALTQQRGGAAAALVVVMTMVWSHSASRAAAVVLASSLRYAGDPEHAKAKPMATEVSQAGAAVAVAWALLAGAPFVAVVGPAAGGAAAAAVMAVAWLCALWLRRRLGGYTGDTLGATQQWSELAAVLAVLAIHRAG